MDEEEHDRACWDSTSQAWADFVRDYRILTGHPLPRAVPRVPVARHW